MYKVEKFDCSINVEKYVEGYVNVDEFVEYCKACPNYGKVWSCPPFDFNPEEYWRGFSELYITARKITFESSATEKDVRDILSSVKADMGKDLYEMENEYPGSRSLSAGTCSLCKEEGCTRTFGEPCRRPETMRYSIESIGGNVGLTASKLMGIELEWAEEGRLPSYFVLVGGLLKK